MRTSKRTTSGKGGWAAGPTLIPPPTLILPLILTTTLTLAGCGADGNNGGGDEIHPGDPLPMGGVSAENWRPTPGGSTTLAAGLHDSLVLLRTPAIPAGGCVAFASDQDPWDVNTCNEVCTGYCGYDQQCHDYPPYVSAGNIVIGNGQVAATLSFDPNCDRGGRYCVEAPPGDPPPGPVLFAGGDTITATAAGGAVPGFTLTGTMPEPLSIVSPEPRVFPDYNTIPAGSDLTFRWTPGGADEIQIRFVSLYPGMVWCRVPDTGEFTVSWDYLQVLPQGTNELEAFLERRTTRRGQTEIGPIDLSLASIDNGTFLIQP